MTFSAKSEGAKPETSKSVLMSIEDIQAQLQCGKNAAYAIARQIGRRLTERRGRLLVTRRAFERWLESGEVGQ